MKTSAQTMVITVGSFSAYLASSLEYAITIHLGPRPSTPTILGRFHKKTIDREKIKCANGK
jgi:hypothetical protein